KRWAFGHVHGAVMWARRRNIEGRTRDQRVTPGHTIDTERVAECLPRSAARAGNWSRSRRSRRASAASHPDEHREFAYHNVVRWRQGNERVRLRNEVTDSCRRFSFDDHHPRAAVWNRGGDTRAVRRAVADWRRRVWNRTRVL